MTFARGLVYRLILEKQMERLDTASNYNTYKGM